MTQVDVCSQLVQQVANLGVRPACQFIREQWNDLESFSREELLQ
jgi:hypothetical protein